MTKQPKVDRRGATAVEFAIVAPVFFLILFALFEFSWLNVVRHTADNAAYEAARVAMVPGATAGEARAEAGRILGVIGVRGATIDVTPPVLELGTPAVTVSVGVPMARNTFVLPKFTGATTLRAESTLRTERVETR